MFCLLTHGRNHLPARDAPDSLDHQQVNAPGTILPSLTSTTRLLSHPQEYPTSRHGSSNTQFYYVPAGDARGLGIITETSESSASLAALSPRQAITNVPPYVNTQIQTLFTTRSDQDNATAPLSSPYIPIAESVKKRAVDGPAAKATEPGVPNVVGRVSPFAVAMSSFTSSPETSVSLATILMPTLISDILFRFYAMGLYGTSTYEVVRLIVGSIAKLF